MEKYSNTLSYLIARGIEEKYSFSYIEKKISYSEMALELERSNVTTIAFSSMERIYNLIFMPDKNDDFHLDIYGIYGWVGMTYMHLFLSLKVTFELLFILLPIEKIIEMYHLYHEMSFSQVLDYVKSLVEHSYLDVVMRDRKMSSNELSKMTSIPFATINALRYGKRDINKIEALKLLKISQALNVKIESLFPNINLTIGD